MMFDVLNKEFRLNFLKKYFFFSFFRFYAMNLIKKVQSTFFFRPHASHKILHYNDAILRLPSIVLVVYGCTVKVSYEGYVSVDTNPRCYSVYGDNE